MKLSVAPIFPVWLIVVLVVLAIALRIAAVVFTGRRRGRMPDARGWLRLGMSLVAVLFLGVAALRVGDESEAQRPPRLTTTADESNVNVFLVVDRSVSITTPDLAGDTQRLAAIKPDLQTVVAKYPKARFSVISYADKGRVDWPLSPDTWSLQPFLGEFTTFGTRYGDGPRQVTAVDVAASNSVLSEQLNRAVHDYPGSANLVYLFGSSSDSDDSRFQVAKGLVSGGAVFGYGTAKGASVFFDPGGSASYQTLKFTLNESALKSAAESLGVPYDHRGAGLLPDDDLAGTPPQAAPVDEIVPAVPHANRIEYYWLFAALAAALFGVEAYGLVRHWLRRRSVGVRK